MCMKYFMAKTGKQQVLPFLLATVPLFPRGSVFHLVLCKGPLALPTTVSHRVRQVTQAEQRPGHSRAGASNRLTQHPLILALFDILYDFCVTFV